MNRIHIISTSAHIPNQLRINEYIECYRLLKKYEDIFSSINIVETISTAPVDYLEDTGFNTFYSKIGNQNNNKGVNWLNHMFNFLNYFNVPENDVIVFITGRYKLINLNIIDIINKEMFIDNNDFVAKEDDDLYVGQIHGVHTFLMFFRKKKFLDFYNWYLKNGNNNDCIEWDVKKYLLSTKNCLILSKDIIMGIETRVDKTIHNKVC